MPETDPYLLKGLIESHAFMSTVEQLERSISRHHFKDLDDRPWSRESYPYIPWSIDRFVENLGVAAQLLEFMNRKKRFLEIGCGYGTKLSLAFQLGWKATGIEINKEYVEFARSVNDHYSSCDNPKIINKDALNHSYKRYDCIYFYTPFHDCKKENELEKKVFSEAPAIIFSAASCVMMNMKSIKKDFINIGVDCYPNLFVRIPDKGKKELIAKVKSYCEQFGYFAKRDREPL